MNISDNGWGWGYYGRTEDDSPPDGGGHIYEKYFGNIGGGHTMASR